MVERLWQPLDRTNLPLLWTDYYHCFWRLPDATSRADTEPSTIENREGP